LRLAVAKLTRGKSTYPSRGGNCYELKVSREDAQVAVRYEILKGAARRKVTRLFPRYVTINESFLWVLGLLKGEGLRSIGSRSSMYRFSVVNNDPSVIRAVIKVLDESGLARFEDVKARGGLIRISYGPFCDKKEAKMFWARELGVNSKSVELARQAEPQKRAIHGSCTFTLNDVLLRRMMDLIADSVQANLFSGSV
jgi:hypothetical protein